MSAGPASGVVRGPHVLVRADRQHVAGLAGQGQGARRGRADGVRPRSSRPSAPTAALGLAATTDAIVRPVRPDDLPRCVELINRTHAGLDLFRPYTVEFLETHLDDPSWGPKPAFWSPVFGWDDYAVVEDAAGDRRRVRRALGPRAGHPRGVDATSRRASSGRSRPPPSSTGATRPGRADAMGALLHSFLERTALLGRTHLLAPFEHTPDLAALVAPLGPELEVRRVRSMTFQDEPGPDRRRADEAVHRPRLLVTAAR